MMGIDFEIGKKIKSEYDDGEYVIEDVLDDNYPNIPGRHPWRLNGNWIGFGYSGFSAFSKRMGPEIDKLFNEFTKEHPGFVRLENHHAQLFHQKLETFKAEHPGLAPAFCTCDRFEEHTCNATTE